MSTENYSFSAKIAAFFKWIWNHTPGLIRHDAPRKLVAALSALGILLFIQNKVESEKPVEKHFSIDIDQDSFIPPDQYYVRPCKGTINGTLLCKKADADEIAVSDLKIRKKIEDATMGADGFTQVDFTQKDLTEKLPSGVKIKFKDTMKISLTPFVTQKGISVQANYNEKDLNAGFSLSGVAFGEDRRRELKVDVSGPEEAIRNLERNGLKTKKIALDQCFSEETTFPIEYDLPKYCKVVSAPATNLRVILKRLDNLELSSVPVSVMASPASLDKLKEYTVTITPATVKLIYRSKNNVPLDQGTLSVYVALPEIKKMNEKFRVKIQCDQKDVTVFQKLPLLVNVKIEPR